MADASVLRLFAFRPVDLGSVFDAGLRDRVLPDFVALPGLVDAFVGRQGPDEAGARLIVSVWETTAAMATALNGSTAGHGFQLELAAEVRDPEISVLPLEVAIAVPDAEPATVLRLFRGTVREGQLDAYVDEVRKGTRDDIDAGSGPLALYLGIASPTDFVTVSAWATWDALSAATGSNTRQPFRTRHAGRLVSWTASHFEVLPDAAGRPVRPVALGD